MFHTLGGAVVAALIHTQPIPVKCDANTDVHQDCLDGFKDAAKQVFKKSDEGERTTTVGEAVRKCIQCASESLSDKMHRFGEE